MANRLQYARDFNPYAKDVTLEELQSVRRQLAKVMNQRMVRLEQSKSDITGESYTFGAYDIMSDYLSGKDRNRFSEVLKPSNMTKSDIQKEIRALQGFEEMKSSRVGGMKEIERARIKTFTGGDMNISEEVVKSKDFYDFLNSATYEELTRSFDSETLIEEYSKAAERGATKKQIVKALNDYSKRSKRVSVKGIQKQLGAIKIRGNKRKK